MKSLRTWHVTLTLVAVACGTDEEVYASDCADFDACDEQSGPQDNLCINEFMASNSWTTPDENGAYSDWIEIHNPNEETVSLTGLTITDDLTDPEKHILVDLEIEGGEYLLFWADGTEDAKDTHLPFKLDQGGESLGLFHADGSVIEALDYDTQATDFSASRIPDCSDAWEIVDEPTPETSNGER